MDGYQTTENSKPTPNLATEDSGRNETTLSYHNKIPRDEVEWILFQSAAGIFTIISLYLTFALLHYHYKRRKCDQRTPVSFRTHRRLTVSSSIISESAVRRRKKIFHELYVISAAVTITMRMLSEHAMLNFYNKSVHVCRVLSCVHVIMYALPIAFIYLYLWARQRIFYSSCGALTEFNSRKVRFASAAILVCMVVGAVATILVFTVTLTYKPATLGCDLYQSLLPKWMPWAMVIAFSAVFQILLLSLYIVPIMRLRIQSGETGERKYNEIRRHGTNDIGGSLRRACTATFTCITSDLLACAITYLILLPLISNFIYNLNLLVNLVGIICSFSDWRQRLCPLVAPKRNCFPNDHAQQQNTTTVNRNHDLPRTIQV